MTFTTEATVDKTLLSPEFEICRKTCPFDHRPHLLAELLQTRFSVEFELTVKFYIMVTSEDKLSKKALFQV